MSSFWGSFFEHLRTCGRSVMLFMVTLAVLWILLIVAAVIVSNDLQKYILPALPVVAIWLLIWGAVVLRRARFRRRHRLERRPLSFDEMRKARLKLSRTKAAPGTRGIASRSVRPT